MSASASPPSNLPVDYLENIKKIPQQELYRLIVDGRYHATQRGWFEYAQRERDSISAVFNALEFAFTQLGN